VGYVTKVNTSTIRLRFKYCRQLLLDKDAEIGSLRQNPEDAYSDIRSIQEQAHHKVYLAQCETNRARDAVITAENSARRERLQRDDDNRRHRLGLRVY
jgi:hypothetical protein